MRDRGCDGWADPRAVHVSQSTLPADCGPPRVLIPELCASYERITRGGVERRKGRAGQSSRLYIFCMPPMAEAAMPESDALLPWRARTAVLSTHVLNSGNATATRRPSASRRCGSISTACVPTSSPLRGKGRGLPRWRCPHGGRQPIMSVIRDSWRLPLNHVGLGLESCTRASRPVGGLCDGRWRGPVSTLEGRGCGDHS